MREADLVFDAFASRRLIVLLSDRDPSLDQDRAYAIAGEVHQRRIERGEEPVGRKIGFTNKTLWSQRGLDAPIWGHIYDSTVQQTKTGSAQVGIGHLIQPRIEPEIQLHFARTPPVTRDETAILECIDWIAHGFEIVQCPFRDWKFKVVDAIAACAVHGLLVVGPPVAVIDIDDCASKLGSFTITLARDGEQKATGGGDQVLGSPLLAFAHLTEVPACRSPSPSPAPEEPPLSSTIHALQSWHRSASGAESPLPDPLPYRRLRHADLAGCLSPRMTGVNKG